MTRPTVLLLALLPLLAHAAQPAEERIKGAWRDADRKSLIQFTKEADGWVGTVVQAQRKEEVGKRVFRKLVYDPGEGVYTGLLVRPDADEDALKVTVEVTSNTTLKAVVKKLFLSKTLLLTRE